MAGYDLDVSAVHVRCEGKCGFVVNDRYFEEKPRFTSGICPRCGSPTYLVKPYTTETSAGWEMNPKSGRISRVVPSAV